MTIEALFSTPLYAGPAFIPASPRARATETRFRGLKLATIQCAALNQLAFAFHTVRDCLEFLWKEACQAKRTRMRFFERNRTITAYLVFPDCKTLMITLIKSRPPPEIERQISG
jgi:hypothetical protein